MTRVATGWLVYKITGSPLYLGVVGFAGQIPTFIIAPFAGVLVDRFDRRKLLVWTQVLACVQSLALAALTLAKVINIHEVIALSVFQGLINAFDMPGRQAFLVADGRRQAGPGQCNRIEFIDGESRATRRTCPCRPRDCGRRRRLLLQPLTA